MSILDVLTPTYFRQTYLQGVRTSLASCGLGGNQSWALTDDVILEYLVNAVAFVASELDIELRASPRKKFRQRYDQMAWHSEKWYLKSSTVRPVSRVYSLEVQRGRYGQTADEEGYVELPRDWVDISSKEYGSIVVTPYSGAPASIAHFPWGSSANTWFRWMPLFVRITQSTGFEFDLLGTTTVAQGSTTATVANTPASPPEPPVTADITDDILSMGARVKLGSYIVRVMGTPTPSTFTFLPALPVAFEGQAVVLDYDPLIIETVATHAMIPVLEIIAGRMFGPVSGTSVGIDSMSQSKSYSVASGASAFYSQQLRAQERLDKNMVTLASKWRAFNMTSF